MLRTATLRRAALRLVDTCPPNVAPQAFLPNWLDRARVEYTMTRTAALLVGIPDREAASFIRALGHNKEARAHAATGMANWFLEWGEQHQARAKLARDAAGRLMAAGERL